MEGETDLGRRRELLFPLDYEVVVVQRLEDGVEPALVLRPQHAMGAPRPTRTTLAEPTHVSDTFILDPPDAPCGIAIRRGGEASFRVQWLTETELSDARRTSVIHLRPLGELPSLESR